MHTLKKYIFLTLIEATYIFTGNFRTHSSTFFLQLPVLLAGTSAKTSQYQQENMVSSLMAAAPHMRCMCDPSFYESRLQLERPWQLFFPQQFLCMQEISSTACGRVLLPSASACVDMKQCFPQKIRTERLEFSPKLLVFFFNSVLNFLAYVFLQHISVFLWFDESGASFMFYCI